MPKSFQQLAAEPGSPLAKRPANGLDVVAWMRQAATKLQDAKQKAVSAGTRMDAAWDAVLLSSLAVACAEGYNANADHGHHKIVFEGAARAVGLGTLRHDELDTLRDWRNRKYRAQQMATDEEVAEAVALVTPYLDEVAAWLQKTHADLLKRGGVR